MNIGDILRKVGGAVIREAVPGGNFIVNMLNDLLPTDKKLPPAATGADAENAINALPPDQRAIIMSKELDVEIEEIRSWASIQQSLAQADAAGASTRPYIAKMMAWAVVGSIVAIVIVWVFAIADDDVETLKALAASWEALLALLATPTVLLRSYFGMRTDEKKARYSMASGQPIGGIANLIGALKK